MSRTAGTPASRRPAADRRVHRRRHPGGTGLGGRRRQGARRRSGGRLHRRTGAAALGGATAAVARPPALESAVGHRLRSGGVRHHGGPSPLPADVEHRVPPRRLRPHRRVLAGLSTIAGPRTPGAAVERRRPRPLLARFRGPYHGAREPDADALSPALARAARPHVRAHGAPRAHPPGREPAAVRADTAADRGVPAFLWRELGEACGAWVRAGFSRDRAARLDREMRVRHLLGYVAERRATAGGGGGDAVDGHERPAGRPMAPARLVFVHALIAFVVGGAAWDIVRDREHWPFSQYPMFSSVERDWSHRTLRVFAVTRDHREVALLDTRVLHPFDQCRLSTALLRLRGDPHSLDTALADTYRRLAGRRREGAPDAAALRLYELRWTLTRGRTNDGHPDERTMLAEYRRRHGGRTMSGQAPTVAPSADRSTWRRAGRAWSTFWFEPAAPEGLGLARAVFFAALLAIYAREDWSEWGTVDRVFWMPVWLFRVLGLQPAPAEWLIVVQWAFRGALTLAAAGLYTRTACGASFVLGAYLLGLPHNFGHTYHFDALLVFVFGIMACARAGDAWSLDAWRRPTPVPPSAEYTCAAPTRLGGDVAGVLRCRSRQAAARRLRVVRVRQPGDRAHEGALPRVGRGSDRPLGPLALGLARRVTPGRLRVARHRGALPARPRQPAGTRGTRARGVRDARGNLRADGADVRRVPDDLRVLGAMARPPRVADRGRGPTLHDALRRQLWLVYPDRRRRPAPRHARLDRRARRGA